MRTSQAHVEGELLRALTPPRLVDDKVLHEGARPAQRCTSKLTVSVGEEAKVGVKLLITGDLG